MLTKLTAQISAVNLTCPTAKFNNTSSQRDLRQSSHPWPWQRPHRIPTSDPSQPERPENQLRNWTDPCPTCQTLNSEARLRPRPPTSIPSTCCRQPTTVCQEMSILTTSNVIWPTPTSKPSSEWVEKIFTRSEFLTFFSKKFILEDFFPITHRTVVLYLFSPSGPKNHKWSSWAPEVTLKICYL